MLVENWAYNIHDVSIHHGCCICQGGVASVIVGGWVITERGVVYPYIQISIIIAYSHLGGKRQDRVYPLGDCLGVWVRGVYAALV